MENLKPIETLEDILGTINVDESDVLKLFYGIKDGSEHTFEEIATSLNKSADEIREIYTKAFRKLRHPSRRNKISSDEFISSISNHKGYKKLTEDIANKPIY